MKKKQNYQKKVGLIIIKFTNLPYNLNEEYDKDLSDTDEDSDEDI